jgi:predicted dehydrogenase
MPIPLWIALGTFVVLIVGAGSLAAIRGLRAWRDARTVGDALAAELAVVSARIEVAQAAAKRAQGRSAEAREATATLQADLDTLNVLVAELRGLQAKVAPFLALVPTK